MLTGEWGLVRKIRRVTYLPSRSPEPKTRVKCTTTDDARGRAGEEEIRVRDWDGRLERESRRGTYLPSRSPEPETMMREGEPESGEEEIRVRDF
jgi:hypothetical protein